VRPKTKTLYVIYHSESEYLPLLVWNSPRYQSYRSKCLSLTLLDNSCQASCCLTSHVHKSRAKGSCSLLCTKHEQISDCAVVTIKHQKYVSAIDKAVCEVAFKIILTSSFTHLAAGHASCQDNTMRPGSSGIHYKHQVYDLYIPIKRNKIYFWTFWLYVVQHVASEWCCVYPANRMSRARY